jgi:hypothetical protein
MAKVVIKVREQFFIWSTDLKAPITYGMHAEELNIWISYEYDRMYKDFRSYRGMIRRAQETGASWEDGTTLEETTSGNRAGPNGTELTIDEIYARYHSSAGDGQRPEPFPWQKRAGN